MKHTWVAYLVLLVSLLLTVLAWRYVEADVEEQSRVRFEETVNATQNSVGQITSSYIDTLFGARALFRSSQSVERDEWSEYAQGLDPGGRLTGFQALGYAEYVTPAEREAFAETDPARRIAGPYAQCRGQRGEVCLLPRGLRWTARSGKRQHGQR